VHHGGHGSCMSAAFAGTPAVIIPTMAERESNARRMASLGVAELQIPVVDENGEKNISSAAFGESVRTMLADSSSRTKAEALSKRMGEYRGPGAIAERIEELL
jgi:UDP:flavonoid glycosyltransferase YjiC (YdhE family)